MSLTPAQVAPPPAPPAQFYFLLGLLAAEIGLVAARHWWGEILDDLRDVTKPALTFAVVVGAVAGDRVCRRVAVLARDFGRTGFPWVLVLIQIAAYGGLVGYTRHLVSSGLHRAPEGAVWVAAWWAAAATVVALWCWAVLPFRGWCRLVRSGWKDAAVAVLVLGIAWGASRYSRDLWHDLADATLRAVECVLRLFFSDVVVAAEHRVIEAQGFAVHIHPSCSGYEGFGLVVAVVGAYLWLCRRTLRFPAALALLPLAVGASWALNVLRIAALVAIGAEGKPEIAVHGFHTQAGWLAFNVVALGTVVLSRSLPAFTKRAATEPPAPVRGPNPAAPLLVPLLVIVGVAMVTGAVATDGIDRLYAVRVLAAGLVLWAYRSAYAALGWSWSWFAVGIGLVVFGLWIGLEAVLPPSAESPAGDPLSLPAPERWFWLVARIVGAVVLVPIVEELAFRGYLLRRLQGAELDHDMTGRWNWFAVLISSVLFGLLHPDRWIAGTVAGAFFAWAFYRRGRLSDAILAHAVTNAVLAGYVLATGRWELW